MNDLENTSEKIEPVTSSTDGRRNSYTVACEITSQSMNYAACLWRLGVMASPKTRIPPDWDVCANARKCNTCPAVAMRDEEMLAGKSIYFVDRTIVRRSPNAGSWGASKMPAQTYSSASVSKASAPTAPTAPARKIDMLEAAGKTGSYADAITEAIKTAAEAPKPVVATVTKAPPVFVPKAGESPLQMARRIALERSNGVS